MITIWIVLESQTRSMDTIWSGFFQKQEPCVLFGPLVLFSTEEYSSAIKKAYVFQNFNRRRWRLRKLPLRARKLSRRNCTTFSGKSFSWWKRPRCGSGPSTSSTLGWWWPWSTTASPSTARTWEGTDTSTVSSQALSKSLQWWPSYHFSSVKTNHLFLALINLKNECRPFR